MSTSIYEPELDDVNYFVGQRIMIDVEFRKLGVPTDPTIVQVKAKNPVNGSQVVLTYPAAELTRTGIGTYEAAIQVNDPGQWFFRCEGAGIVDAVTEINLMVYPTRVG